MMKNESGRSMVEMLGVLAIIGVLSIGGIAGYTLAMNRYRANEVVNAAAQVAIVAMSKNGGIGENANLADLGGAGTLRVPALQQDDNAIFAQPNGQVTINFDSNYAKVADIVNSMAGSARIVGGACNVDGCTLNLANGFGVNN